ncbi:MAG: hypothetical protein DBX44_06515 [Oscillospiraceae bacterium]|nr:MAG: hypothetical protein DBX44_06515 [Oscillospiraceae bacterium]
MEFLLWIRKRAAGQIRGGPKNVTKKKAWIKFSIAWIAEIYHPFSGCSSGAAALADRIPFLRCGTLPSRQKTGIIALYGMIAA